MPCKIAAIHKLENQSKTDMQPRMVSLMVHWIVSLCFACYHDRLTMYSLCWKEITKKYSCTRFSVCCKLQIKPCAYPVLSVMIIMALMLIIINHVTWYQRSPTVTGWYFTLIKNSHLWTYNPNCKHSYTHTLQHTNELGVYPFQILQVPYSWSIECNSV